MLAAQTLRSRRSCPPALIVIPFNQNNSQPDDTVIVIFSSSTNIVISLGEFGIKSCEEDNLLMTKSEHLKDPRNDYYLQAPCLQDSKVSWAPLCFALKIDS